MDEQQIVNSYKLKIIAAMMNKTGQLLKYVEDCVDNADEFEHAVHNMEEVLKDIEQLH